MTINRYGTALVVLMVGFGTGTAWAVCDYGADTCQLGYVWRDAFPGDHVCVVGATRNQTARDNRLAASRRSPNGGPHGRNTCKLGFVWREASQTDRVCVAGTTRAQTRTDNSQASARRDPRCINDPTISAIPFEFEQPVSGILPPKPSITKRRINSDGSVIGVSQSPLAGEPEKMWNPGQLLRVRMTGGSAIVRSKVRHYAEEWTKYANIRFQFVDDASEAEIKVHFKQGEGSWSVVGRDALLVGLNFPTMNFGWLDDNTTDMEFSRTVLHEFGHALGLIHEHQSPAAGIQWDKEKVYKFFRDTQNSTLGSSQGGFEDL